MMEKINEYHLRDLILKGITSEELNSQYDYSSIIDMSWLFDTCDELETIPYIDTKYVIDMNGMFYRCKNLKTIPNLDTSNVINMNYMFYGCENLESIPHLDTSSVNSMEYMLQYCFKLKDFDPYNYGLFDFKKLDNPWIREQYLELYI